MKSIKIRDSNSYLKTKEYKTNSSLFVRSNTLSTRNEKQVNKSDSSHIEAIDKIENNTKNNTYYTARYSIKFLKRKKETHRNHYATNHNNKHIDRLNYINENKKSNFKSLYKRVVVNNIHNPRNSTFNSNLKFLYNTFKMIKKTLLSFNSLMFYSTSVILLLVMTLYIGVFSSFSNNTVFATSYTPITKEVLQYTNIIEKYAKQYNIKEYVPLIQAIMMYESKGIGFDPMNSSSFKYNKNYPESIKDVEYSIDVGIHYISDCILAANVTSPKDTEKIYLAIQGYNFKINYIHWVLNNFGNYTKSNAQVYSDKMKNKLNLDSYGNPDYVNQVIQYIDISFGEFRLQPNFDNQLAWGDNNPYSRSKLYGQCTWFAWGRFYELYGFDPGFTGDGWDCARQLVKAHPDKFKLSSIPQVGSIFSYISKNHVGIVIGWDGKNITIQEGNLDGKTNSFYEAKNDWQTVTYDIDTFRNIYGGVVFTNYI